MHGPEELSDADWALVDEIGLGCPERIAVELACGFVSVLACPDEDTWYIVSAERIWDDEPVKLSSEDERRVCSELNKRRARAIREDDGDPYGRDY